MGPMPTTPMDLYYKVPNDQQKPTSFSYNSNRCRFFLKIGTYLRIKVPALCCPPVSAFFLLLSPPSLAPFLLTSLSLSLSRWWVAGEEPGRDGQGQRRLAGGVQGRRRLPAAGEEPRPAAGGGGGSCGQRATGRDGGGYRRWAKQAAPISIPPS